MNNITTLPRWTHWEDETAKSDYMRSQGLTAVDIGSRAQLLKQIIKRFKKRSPAYRLKKKQLYRIYNS